MSQVATYIEWDGLTRPDEDPPTVNVHFTAGGWQPRVPATWEQPAEGGLFEDVYFVRAEICPRDVPHCAPLTEAEIAAAREWFKTEEAWEMAQCAAEREAA